MARLVSRHGATDATLRGTRRLMALHPLRRGGKSCLYSCLEHFQLSCIRCLGGREASPRPPLCVVRGCEIHRWLERGFGGLGEASLPGIKWLQFKRKCSRECQHGERSTPSRHFGPSLERSGAAATWKERSVGRGGGGQPQVPQRGSVDFTHWCALEGSSRGLRRVEQHAQAFLSLERQGALSATEAGHSSDTGA